MFAPFTTPTTPANFVDLPGGARRLPPASLRPTLHQRVAALVSNAGACSLAQSYGLAIQRVSWEDTARFKGSCWGPNISDMTLACGGATMPVIRRPNMADLTCDVPSANFNVLVGNEAGAPLSRVSLEEYVRAIQRHTGNAAIGDLWAPRDAHLLLSSQACILPVDTGKANFHVRLFNYQSTYSQPAVLVIMATHQGTSCQVITGTDDLYLNLNGQAHDLQAQRLADDRAARGAATTGAMTDDEKARNVIFIYQIPLKTRRQALEYATFCVSNCLEEEEDGCCLGGWEGSMARGFDHAMVSAGGRKGAYKGTRGLALERDPNYPIRLTVQYYYVTDTDVIPESLMQSIAAQLERSYAHGDNKGSLVFGGADRPTAATALPSCTSPLSCCV